LEKTVNKATISLYAVIGAALLGGCAAQQNIAKLEVAPVLSVRHGGGQSQGYYELGRYYQAQNRSLLAVDAYRKALALDDRNAAAHSALGIALAAQGEVEPALAEFNAAIASAADVPHYYNNSGYAYYLLGRPAEAVAALRKAASLDSANPRVWNNLALAYARGGDPAGSREAAARALEVAAAPPVGVLAAAPRLSVSPVSTATGERQPAAQLVQVSAFVFELRASQPITRSPAVLPVALPAALMFSLEVSNGNGVTGMARRMGQMLAAIGAPKALLTNQKPFVQQVTEIQYREAYEAAAMALRGRIPGTPVLVMSNTLRPGTDVRLVLGRDLPADVALLEPALNASRVAAMPPRTFPETN
jgi:tetratricopeptide (TPR) repeat protein